MEDDVVDDGGGAAVTAVEMDTKARSSTKQEAAERKLCTAIVLMGNVVSSLFSLTCLPSRLLAVLLLDYVVKIGERTVLQYGRVYGTAGRYGT
jgi:hypothetical protein